MPHGARVDGLGHCEWVVGEGAEPQEAVRWGAPFLGYTPSHSPCRARILTSTRSTATTTLSKCGHGVGTLYCHRVGHWLAVESTALWGKPCPLPGL